MNTAFKCAGFGCVKVNQCAHAHNDSKYTPVSVDPVHCGIFLSISKPSPVPSLSVTPAADQGLSTAYPLTGNGGGDFLEKV